jgi:hypothetical protein
MTDERGGNETVGQLVWHLTQPEPCVLRCATGTAIRSRHVAAVEVISHEAAFVHMVGGQTVGVLLANDPAVLWSVTPDWAELGES